MSEPYVSVYGDFKFARRTPLCFPMVYKLKTLYIPIQIQYIHFNISVVTLQLKTTNVPFPFQFLKT